MASKFECNPRPTGRVQVNGLWSIELQKQGDTISEPHEQFHLFRVRAAWREVPGQAAHFAEVFVLAATVEDAIGQAQCGLKVETLYAPAGNRPLLPGSLTMSAERVPFFVRGWGDEQF